MRSAVLVLLAACSAPPEPDVAFVVAHAEDLPALTAATSGLRSLGLVASDAATQRAQVQRAIDAGVRVLVIEPVDDRDATELLTLAHERGVRVVAYGRELPGRSDGDTIDALVAFDGYRAGALLAAAAVPHRRIAILADANATGFAAEVARGYTHTLAPYIARGEVSLVDASAADAVLALEGARLGGTRAFAASADGSCVGTHDVRLDRAALATAAGAITRRLAAGEDLGKDPLANRLPGRRLPVELATVTAVRCR